jgi:putative ABC transport system substrate-binding protein
MRRTAFAPVVPVLFLAAVHSAGAFAADVLYLDPLGNPVDHGIQKFRMVYDRHVRPLHPKATFEHRIVPNDTPERTAAALKADRAAPPKLVFTADGRIAMAVRKEMPGVPMVFLTMADPVILGVSDDPIAPRANVTGYSDNTPVELKHVELLLECVPSIRRIGVVADEYWTQLVAPRRLFSESQELFGVAVILVRIVEPGEIARMAQIAASERLDAWFVPDTPFSRVNYREIAQQIRATRKPWIAGNRSPDALLTYAAERFDPWPRVAEMISLVLSGVPAREIPFERPKRFELIVNQATARDLGVNVPKSILVKAHVLKD